MDLTKITTPFGLLDVETQEALKAHGGPYEVFMGNPAEWREAALVWASALVARVKPQPPKPREWWMCGGYIHHTKYNAEAWARSHPGEAEIIHVREVIE